MIQDGIINEQVLKDLGKDVTWLKRKLHEKGYENTSQIFICMIMKNGLYLLEKK